MSKGRLEKRRLTRWAFVAVAVCGGALALMTMGGCASSPAPPPQGVSTAPATESKASAAAASACGTCSEVHPYVVTGDANGVPKWVTPPKKFHAKRGECVLFVNHTATPVTVTVKVTGQTFKVFDQGDVIDLGPNESACRTISTAIAEPKIGVVELPASYDESATGAGQPTTIAAAATATQTSGTATSSSGKIKPLGGPGMDID